MKKTYYCSSCQASASRMSMTCPSCKRYGTIEEKIEQPMASRAGLKSSESTKPIKAAKTLSELSEVELKRIPTGIGELDRVLGGGFVPAEVVLLAGSPGSGKSTLCLDIANKFASTGKRVLYSSGEESEGQISIRAKRMGIDSEEIRVINETNLESLLGYIESENPELLILDSLQTIASSNITSGIGSVQQSKEAAHALTRLAKSTGIVMILVNQVIKGGEEFAGSNQVPHIVDATIMLESDKDSPLKLLRAHKNRFGETDQVGIFIHQDNGLAEVKDPSSLLQDASSSSSGAAITFVSQGIRQLPVEIQALVVDSNAPNPRKQFSGVDYAKGQIVSAVVSKFCRMPIYEKDVFVSTAAGMKTDDTQGELALAAALISSLKDIPIPKGTAFVGEVNLTGAVKGDFRSTAKVKEAERLGFTRVVLPENCKTFVKNANIKISWISTVDQLTSVMALD